LEFYSTFVVSLTSAAVLACAKRATGASLLGPVCYSTFFISRAKTQRFAGAMSL